MPFDQEISSPETKIYSNSYHLYISLVYLVEIVAFLVNTPVVALAQAPQSVRFERISIEQGLPSRYAFGIAQDSLGFIWIGTSYGLCRYDGYGFKIFQSDPHTSDPINSIVWLQADHKSRLWIATQLDGLKYLDLTTGQFHHFRHDPQYDNSLSSNDIWSVLVDSQGTVWAGSYGGGLNKWEEGTSRFTRYRHIPGDTTSLSNDRVVYIMEDSEGQIWLATQGGGVNRLNRERGTFTRLSIVPEGSTTALSPAIDNIVSLYEDKEQNLWIGTSSQGIIHWDRKQDKFTRYQHNPTIPHSISNDHILAISQNHNNGLWISTAGGGINYFDFTSKQFQVFRHDPGNPFSPSIDFGAENVMLVDKENNLWTGSILGVNRLIQTFQPFVTYVNDPKNPNSLNNNQVLSVFEDHQGVVWIGTNGGGLNRLDPTTASVRHYLHQPGNVTSISSNYVSDILEDNNHNLWIASSQGGLDLLDRSTNEFRRFQHAPLDTTTISSTSVYRIFEDRSGRLWVGGDQGLDLFDPKSMTFKSYPYHQGQNDAPFFIINDMVEDDQGHLWIPYRLQGLVRLDPETRTFVHFQNKRNDANTISSNYINQLLIDKNGHILVASSAGLDRIVLGSEPDTPLIVERQLIKTPVNQVLEDRKGILWIATLQKGLIRYDPRTGETRNFDQDDGLLSTSFGNGSFISQRTGKLYFVSDLGLVSFHPDSLRNNPVPPPIAFTSLSYLDRKGESNEAKFVEQINYSREVTLHYHQNTINIEFAALSYNKSPKNQYAYLIEGINDNWIHLGVERRLTLTNLRPGTYPLRIKGSNGDLQWNDEGTRLAITILPPWYWSLPAKIGYALLLIGALFAFYRFQLNRQLARAETERLRELDEVKTRLYTNITHEFRTPLTIILGMADQAVNNPKDWLLEGIRMIKRNGNRLLHLVNQMLDLSKLESGSMPLNMVNADIIRYLRYINESFHSYAEIKGISLHFLTLVDRYSMDFDPGKLLDIISNLISNAVKYSPEGGNVYLHVQEIRQDNAPWLELKVIDTGMGIRQEELEQIFDRFYQAGTTDTRKSEGTGIGLALTRELVKLMGGDIKAESQPGKGSTFTVLLPVSQQAPRDEQPEEQLVQSRIQPFAEKAGFSSPEEVAPEKTNLPLLLIIEDNQDVVQYLISCLDQEYQLVTAPDGQAGIDRAVELIPDIIISDVMMPEKDGFEVCHTLKLDERTSHIPIILLTAKADIESKLEGLEHGADAYLAKPFNERELNIRLKKLIELRQQLQQSFSNFTGEAPAESTRRHPIEDEFLRKVRELVQANISDADYGIVQLCRALHLSRSQLFRKLKALTDKSTSLVVRSIRLQRAKEMLLTTDLNVSEIAYEVGFTSPAYFTRAFSEEFGVPPSEFRSEK